jgi:hypothetical protein
MSTPTKKLLSDHDVRFDLPLYTLAEAASALDDPASTIDNRSKG